MSPDVLPRPLWGLLPVKDFGRAKSRLAAVLRDAERAALARRLCQHVLRTLRDCQALDGVLVLSDSAEVRGLAQQHGHLGEPEPALPSPTLSRPLLGSVVDAGLLRLRERGAVSALVLMSDLPRLQPAELQAMLALLTEHDCVIAPDLRQQNTNALALRLADQLPLTTAFGSGESFAHHLAWAQKLGLRTAIHQSHGLGFDLDLPSDWAELGDWNHPLRNE